MESVKKRKQYAVCKKSARKPGATEEKIEAATLGTFNAYEEAYKAARAYLDGRPKRRLVFLQVWEEDGEGKRLCRQYDVIQKSPQEIKAKETAKASGDPNAEIWAELDTIEGQAKRTEKAERRKAAKRRARLAEAKNPEDGKKAEA